MSSLDISDFSLLKLAKSSSDMREGNKAKMTLFTRYRGMVMKHWRQFQRMFPTVASSMEQEDFESDAYFSFERAVAQLDLEKCGWENWKFFWFNYALKSQRNDYVRRYNKTQGKNRPFLVMEDDSSEEDFLIAKETPLDEDFAIKEGVKDLQRVLKNTLGSRKYNILMDRVTRGEKLQEIGNKNNVSKERVRQIIKKIGTLEVCTEAKELFSVY